MKQNQLDRIIRLVRRTGDRFVIMDKETDETMVLMNLNEYENLLNDTSTLEDLEEEDMLNKLNNDISRWQEQKNRQSVPDWDESVKKESFQPVERMKVLADDIEDSELEEEFEDVDLVAKNEVTPEPILEPMLEKALEASSIPLEPTQVEQTFGEESLAGLPEGEEEKFYLEPIE